MDCAGDQANKTVRLLIGESQLFDIEQPLDTLLSSVFDLRFFYGTALKTGLFYRQNLLYCVSSDKGGPVWKL